MSTYSEARRQWDGCLGEAVRALLHMNTSAGAWNAFRAGYIELVAEADTDCLMAGQVARKICEHYLTEGWARSNNHTTDMEANMAISDDRLRDEIINALEWFNEAATECGETRQWELGAAFEAKYELLVALRAHLDGDSEPLLKALNEARQYLVGHHEEAIDQEEEAV